MLDNMYLVNRPRPAVSDAVDLASLIDWTPGMPIRMRQGQKPSADNLAWVTVPSQMTDALAVLQWKDEIQQKRTGVTPNNQGVPDEAMNPTATGAAIVTSAADARIELIARTLTAVASGVPTFRLLSPRPVFTAALGADVALSNTGTRFTGPSVAQGNDGLWLVTGQLVVQDTAAANGARFYGFLSDGTTTIASAAVSTYLANAVAILSMSGIIAQPAGNLRLAAQDATAATGRILGNVSGGGKDSTITAVRLD
jgi:hypothetical protein